MLSVLYDALSILPEEFPREKMFISTKKKFRFKTFKQAFNVGHYKGGTVETQIKDNMYVVG